MAGVYGPVASTSHSDTPSKAFLTVQLTPLSGISGPAERSLETDIQRALEPLILFSSLPLRSKICLTLQVLGSPDGPLLPTALNAAALALIDTGIPLLAVPAAVSVALTRTNHMLLDPTVEETLNASSVHTLAFVQTDTQGSTDKKANLVLMSSVGECTRDDLRQVYSAAEAAAGKVAEFMRLAVIKRLERDFGKEPKVVPSDGLQKDTDAIMT